MKEQTKNIILLIGFIYLILGILFYLGTAITGYVIYVQTEYALNITPENFIYNSSLILIENNKITLYPTILTENITKEITNNIYIISAKIDNADFTDKLIALDNNTINMHENKNLDLIFNNNLANNDKIRLYIKRTGKAKLENFYLCNYEEDCDINQSYGSVEFLEEGWYNLTIQNLNYPSSRFSLVLSDSKGADKVKIDYIDSTNIEIIIYINNIIKYPESAELISKEINLNGTIQAIIINETLNNNTIINYYSLDSGQNWSELLNEIINSTNNKIALKSVLTSANNQTPEINGIKIIYLESTEEPLNETQNQTIEDNTTIETPTNPSGGSSGGGGGGGGSSKKNTEEKQPITNMPPEITSEVYEIPKQQQKEAIIIGQTNIPKQESNVPFLVGLTARIVYSGKGMLNFLFDNWGWLLLIILLLLSYIYLYLKRRNRRKKHK